MKKLLISLLGALFLSMPAFGMQEAEQPVKSRFVAEIKALLADLDYFDAIQRKKCVDAIANVLDLTLANSVLTTLPHIEDKEELMDFFCKKIFKSNKNSRFMSTYQYEYSLLNAEQLVFCYYVTNKSIKDQQEAITFLNTCNRLLAQVPNIRHLINSLLQEAFGMQEVQSLSDICESKIIQYIYSNNLTKKEVEHIADALSTQSIERQARVVREVLSKYVDLYTYITVCDNDPLIIDMQISSWKDRKERSKVQFTVKQFLYFIYLYKNTLSLLSGQPKTGPLFEKYLHTLANIAIQPIYFEISDDNDFIIKFCSDIYKSKIIQYIYSNNLTKKEVEHIADALSTQSIERQARVVYEVLSQCVDLCTHNITVSYNAPLIIDMQISSWKDRKERSKVQFTVKQFLYFIYLYKNTRSLLSGQPKTGPLFEKYLHTLADIAIQPRYFEISDVNDFIKLCDESPISDFIDLHTKLNSYRKACENYDPHYDYDTAVENLRNNKLLQNWIVWKIVVDESLISNRFSEEIKIMLAKLDYFNAEERKKCIDRITEVRHANSLVGPILNNRPCSRDWKVFMDYILPKIFPHEFTDEYYQGEMRRLSSARLVLYYCATNQHITGDQGSIENKIEELIKANNHNNYLEGTYPFNVIIDTRLKKMKNTYLSNKRSLQERCADVIANSVELPSLEKIIRGISFDVDAKELLTQALIKKYGDSLYDDQREFLSEGLLISKPSISEINILMQRTERLFKEPSDYPLKKLIITKLNAMWRKCLIDKAMPYIGYGIRTYMNYIYAIK